VGIFIGSITDRIRISTGTSDQGASRYSRLFGQSLTVAASYLIVAGILAACAKYAVVTPKAAEEEERAHQGAVPGSAAT